MLSDCLCVFCSLGTLMTWAWHVIRKEFCSILPQYNPLREAMSPAMHQSLWARLVHIHVFLWEMCFVLAYLQIELRRRQFCFQKMNFATLCTSDAILEKLKICGRLVRYSKYLQLCMILMTIYVMYCLFPIYLCYIASN